jgi:DNA polymerase-3 subunit epsilon
MRLIILDTETTGLSPAEGRIVEIAAVEMLDGKLTGREFPSSTPNAASY